MRSVCFSLCIFFLFLFILFKGGVVRYQFHSFCWIDMKVLSEILPETVILFKKFFLPFFNANQFHIAPWYLSIKNHHPPWTLMILGMLQKTENYTVKRWFLSCHMTANWTNAVVLSVAVFLKLWCLALSS